MFNKVNKIMFERRMLNTYSKEAFIASSAVLYLYLKPALIIFSGEIRLPLSTIPADSPIINCIKKDGIEGIKNGRFIAFAAVRINSLFVMYSGATALYTPFNVMSSIDLRYNSHISSRCIQLVNCLPLPKGAPSPNRVGSIIFLNASLSFAITNEVRRTTVLTANSLLKRNAADSHFLQVRLKKSFLPGRSFS